MKRIRFNKESVKKFWSETKTKWKERRQKKAEKRAALIEKRQNGKWGKRMAPVYKWLNRLSLLAHFVWAFLLNLIIESISRHSLFKAINYLVASPWTYLFNTYIIFITFLLVYLSRKRVFWRSIISVLWLVLGIVNGYMLSVRVTPFNAQDMLMLSDAISMADKYFNLLGGIAVIIGFGLVITLLCYLFRMAGTYKGKMHRVIALIVNVIAFATVGFVTDYAVNSRVVSDFFGNIAFAYEDYGLPYCFSASVFNTGIDEPDNYSEEEVNRVTQNGKITQVGMDNDVKPNIIMIQLESFFDTDEAEFFTSSQDPIPTFHYLMENYSSGYCKVPSVGAGTANTEFEVLTGMSMRYFGPGEYPYKTTVDDLPVESIATALRELGYGAFAMHNNGGRFYSRHEVYNMMGFQNYTSMEFMQITGKTENEWATDDVLTKYILQALDNTEHQDLVFAVSVEGHGAYPETSVIKNPLIKVEGIEDEGQKYAWEYFVNHLHATDQFIADLLQELEKRNEPTVLVLYGDHLPTMGLEAKDLKSRYLFNTNYVIWDNIGLEKEDRNVPTYQLTAEVFDKLGIHSGTVFNYHQERRQSKNYLADLEMLQYDMLFGERYVYGGEENAPQVDGLFRMGIKDVVLTSIQKNNSENYYLYGENITQHSAVFVDGDEESSKYHKEGYLELYDVELEEGSIIVISQVSDSTGDVFCSSEEYVYTNGALEPASK